MVELLELSLLFCYPQVVIWQSLLLLQLLVICSVFIERKILHIFACIPALAMVSIVVILASCLLIKSSKPVSEKYYYSSQL